MSHNGNNLYEFGDFSFDAGEKVLLRAGKPVPMTPKTLELLRVLIKSHGRIVGKEELMSEVWADSFVEESNLTFTIRQLRKALADNAHQPTYVETVSRRGYRFIGEVRETLAEDKAAETFPPAAAAETFRSSNKSFLSVAAAVVIALCSIGFASWFVQKKVLNSGLSAQVLAAPFSSEKLSTDGNVRDAVVSPDGKNVIYLTANDGKQSVWLRQLESSNNVQIISPSDDFYYGLAFSPDGNFLYFTRKPKLVEVQADLYRISIFGGVPFKVAAETQGWISVSPDGGKISFVRCYYREDENCSLWIADSADGQNQRKLASRPRPFRIGDNSISPDGRTVAFAAGQSRNGANEFGLVEVDVESGAERELTAQKFFNIKSLEWLPNQNGLLITASRVPNRAFRIWQISAASGDAEPLTRDSEEYSALSLNKDASVLVSTQVKQDFRLQLYRTENPAAAPRVLAIATTAVYAPNGKIIFSSSMTGNSEIWSINEDGGEQRQLTNDAADDITPIVSPDNNSVFFSSNRTGAMHVWQMNADGSNQKQVTNDEGGFPLSISSDGKWLYYSSALQKTLRRVSTASGEETAIVNRANDCFAISPDGLYTAFAERQNAAIVLTIASLDDKRTIKSFKTADGKSRLIQLVWSPDGNALWYISADSEFENNTLWRQPLDGGLPRQIADLGDKEIYGLFGFALSPDGKSFAVVQGGWQHDAVLLKGLR